MKIPTYNRQTAFPIATGGGAISTQINPNVLGGLAEPAIIAGRQIQKLGLEWMAETMAADNAASLASEEGTFSAFLMAVNEETLTQDASAYTDTTGPKPRLQTMNETIAATQRRLHEKRKVMMAAIGNRAVRQQFAAWSAGKISTVTPGLNNTIRGKYSDYYKAIYHVERNRRLTDIQQSTDPGSPERKVEMDSHEKWLRKQHVLGGFKLEDTEKLWRQDVVMMAKADAAELISKADTSEAAQELANALNDSDMGLDLDVDDRLELAAKVQRKADTLIRREVATRDKADRAEEKKVLADQDALNVKFSARIEMALEAMNQGDFEGDMALDMPTHTDLNEALQNGLLKDDAHKRLVAKLEGRDAIRNPNYYQEITGQIYDAVNEEDLRYLQRKIDLAHVRGQLGLKGFQAVVRVWQGARGKTPAFAEAKNYRTLLGQIISKTAGPANLPSYIGGLADEAVHSRAAATHMFNDLITQGVRPAEAYYTTLTAFVDQDDRAASALAVIKGLPSGIAAMFPTPERSGIQEGPAYIKKLNADHIAAAWEVWRTMLGSDLSAEITKDVPAYETDKDKVSLRGATPEQLRKKQFADKPEDRITRSERITVRRLHTIEEQLRFLENIVDFKDTGVPPPDEPPVSESAPSVPVPSGKSEWDEFTDDPWNWAPSWWPGQGDDTDTDVPAAPKTPEQKLEDLETRGGLN